MLISITPNVSPVGGDQTNSISFQGKAAAGKRLSLVASTSFGRVTYRGVPFRTTLPDISGNWYGTKKQQGQSFLEFFDLTPSTFPNIYYMDGHGPAYTYTNGMCMVSAQKKIGFALLESDGTNTTLRATFGGFNSNSRNTKGNTKGVIDPGTRIHFKAAKSP